MISVPYSRPEIGKDEIDEVVDTLQSGWLTSGPKVKKFEEDFVNFLDKSIDAISVNSATAGLHLALEALGVKSGDEVIVPTLTFTASAEVVRYMGAEVKLVDIDPSTLNMGFHNVKDAISNKTKAIIIVHYAGLSCEMDELLALAKSKNIRVIEDAAHALSASYKGTKIGLLSSDATVFSFYANKTMTTGEGEMIVVKDKSIASRIKLMRSHGIDRDAFDRFNSIKSSWYYEIHAAGFKYNMNDIAAAIGIHQLKKLPNFLETRQQLAKKYFSELSDLPLILPPKGSKGIHAWHLFVVRIHHSSKKTRDEVISFLNKRNIGTSVHYNPLHNQPYWKNRYNLSSEMFPEAEKAYQTMISLPLFTLMTYEQQEHIIKELNNAFKS